MCTIIAGNIDFIKCDGWVIILSVDPGTTNFAYRIEQRVFDTERKYCIDVKALIMEKVPLKPSTMYTQMMNEVFKKNAHYIEHTRVLIVEKQYSRLESGYLPTRAGQHIIGCFMMMMEMKGVDYCIIEVDLNLRKTELNGPKGRPQLKKWSLEKSIELAKIRNDEYSLSELTKKGSKRDDESDTDIQIEAAFSRLKLPLTYNSTHLWQKTSSQSL